MGVWLNFYLFLIYMKINRIYSSECIPTPEYANFKVTAEELKICRSQKCYLYLEHSGVYDGCQLNDNKIQNRFVIKMYTKHFHYYDTINSTICDSNSDGVWKADDCELVQNLVFKPPKKMTPYDVFVLSCGPIPGIYMNTDGELPYADYPRFQILNFDYIEAFTDFKTKFHPTLKIQCVAQCQEFKPLAKMKGNGTGIYCEFDTCYVSWTNKATDDVLVCGTDNNYVMVKYQTIVNFDVTVFSIRSGPIRVKPKFDAGEYLTCDAKDSDAKDSDAKDSDANDTNHLPSSEFITYIYFGRFRNDNVDDKFMRQIPEYASSPFEVTCYVGIVRNYGINYRYWPLKTINVDIAANVFTELEANAEPIKSKGEYALNYPLSTTIRCNRKKFPTSGTLIVFTLEKALYPLSGYFDYPGLNKEVVYKDEFILQLYTGTTKKLRYATCWISVNVMSAPVLIYMSNRPSLSWWFINPPWETQFQMRTFLIACIGEHVESMTVTCDDCPKNITIVNIVGLRPNLISIEVSQYARAYNHYTITCNGISRFYPDIQIKKGFIVVEPTVVGLNRNVKVYLLNRDSVGCYAQFNYFDGGARIMTIPVMIMIKQKDIITQASTKSPEIPLSSVEDYPTFEYCCPHYVKDLGNIDKTNYTCGHFYKLKVAKNIETRLTPKEDNIYVGDIIRCHLCVIYTDVKGPSKCTGKNRIETLINANIIYPNKTAKFYYAYNEIQIPNVELNKRTKKYYEPSDYLVTFVCLTKIDDRNAVQKQIYLRSCNTSPPPIYIMPRGKTLFEVGEIFSCSTSSDSCKDVMKFTLSIARGFASRSINLSVNSYKFLRTDLGNDIVIRCSAGTKVNFAEDRRVVRVEVHPFNISILNNNGLMFYKDYISCKCSGYPKPEILWKQLEGPTRLRISEGMVLVGPWDMTGSYGFNCMAENKLGVLRANAFFYLYNPRFRYNTNNDVFNLFIPISTAICIMLIILALFLIFQESIFGVPFFSYSSKVDIKLAKTRKSSSKSRIDDDPNVASTETDDKEKQVNFDNPGESIQIVNENDVVSLQIPEE